MLRRKLLIVILILIATSSCCNVTSKTPSQSPSHSDNKSAQPRQVNQSNSSTLPVLQAIALAQKQQDYRLWVTATRGDNVPGLPPADFSVALILCGKQYMPNTGDVITTEQARAERKKVLIYMQQYNVAMWPICQRERKKMDG